MAQHHLADAQVGELLAHLGTGGDPAGAGLGDEAGDPAPTTAARAHAAERLALEREHRARHAPPAVDFADDVGVGHRHCIEEHLTEVRVAGHLAQRPHRDARRMHVDREHRDALALGAVGVGARQTRGVVAVLRARRPHLLPVEDPRVAVAARRASARSQGRSPPPAR